MAITVDRQRWGELDRLLGETHDHDFDVDGASYDASAGLWRIRCATAESVGLVRLRDLPRIVLGRRTRREPVFDRVLTVSGVRGWRCKDRAQIGVFTLNVIKFDARRDRLVLRFCEDCVVYLDVAPGFTITLT